MRNYFSNDISLIHNQQSLLDDKAADATSPRPPPTPVAGAEKRRSSAQLHDTYVPKRQRIAHTKSFHTKMPGLTASPTVSDSMEANNNLPEPFITEEPTPSNKFIEMLVGWNVNLQSIYTHSYKRQNYRDVADWKKWVFYVNVIVYLNAFDCITIELLHTSVQSFTQMDIFKLHDVHDRTN